MANPTGKNQYSGGGKGRGAGGSKGSGGRGSKSIKGKAKAIAKKTESTPGFNFHGGATSASHAAFVESRLRAQAARKKKKR